MSSEAFADWLRAAMDRQRIATPSELAKRAGIDQSIVSRWLRENTQPTVPALRRIAPVLGVGVLELLVRAGHLEPSEVDVDLSTTPGPAPQPDVISSIESDPDLLPEAKEHLVNQYGLLLRVQAMSRLPDRDVPDTEGPGLRAVARRRRGGTRGRRGTDN